MSTGRAVRSVAAMTTLTENHVRTHRIVGGGGCRLFVEESGNPDGPAVLFIHGFSQSRLAWRRQLTSELARSLRLVALDLRGHGGSDAPPDAYGEPFLWADDIQAVVAQLGLDRPVLCGWSYGGVVIGDYLRCHGERALGGVVLVAAATRLGEPMLPHLGADFLGVLPGLFSTDVGESGPALRAFLAACTATPPAPADFYTALGYNSAVPPHVRQAMLSRTVVHDEVYANLEAPVLLVHGTEDRIVLPTMSEVNADLMPRAQTSYYAGIGHTPFTEDAARFDAELLEFTAGARRAR